MVKYRVRLRDDNRTSVSIFYFILFYCRKTIIGSLKLIPFFRIFISMDFHINRKNSFDFF